MRGVLARHTEVSTEPRSAVTETGSPSGYVEPPAPAAVGALSAEAPVALHRSRRDSLLGAMGLTSGSSFLLYAIGSVLLLVDLLNNHAIAGLSIAQGLDLVFSIVLIDGLSLVGTAFLIRPARRASMLRNGSAIVAGAFITEFISLAITAGVVAAHHAPGTLTASFIVQALGRGLATAFAVVVSIAFGTAAALPAGGHPRRDMQLGWASIVGAAAALLVMVGAILSVIAPSDLGSAGGDTAGVGIAAGGLAALMGALVITAVALMLSSQHQRWHELRCYRAAMDSSRSRQQSQP